MPSKERLEQAAALHDAASEELERAARHCRTAAEHYRAGEVPRAAAHAWAALGHLRSAEASLDEQARMHARTSTA